MARRPRKPDAPDPDEVHRAMLEHLERNPPPRRRAPTGGSGRRKPARSKKSDPGPKRPAAPPRAPSRPRLMLRLLRLEDALERLETQVRYHCAQGTPEIVVVVGRGKRSAGAPVIGPAVRRWCDAHRGLVEAWHEAPASEGGEGALVLRLVARPRGG